MKKPTSERTCPWARLPSTITSRITRRSICLRSALVVVSACQSTARSLPKARMVSRSASVTPTAMCRRVE